MSDRESEHVIDKINRLLADHGEGLFWFFVVFLGFVLFFTIIVSTAINMHGNVRP